MDLYTWSHSTRVLGTIYTKKIMKNELKRLKITKYGIDEIDVIIEMM